MASTTGIDYGAERDRCNLFLATFVSPYEKDDDAQPKYLQKLQEIANRERKMLDVELDDVMAFDDKLARSIQDNAWRYVTLFCEAADALMPAPTQLADDSDDLFDVLLRQRMQDQERAAAAAAREEGDSAGGEAGGAEQQRLPPSLVRRYEVVFVPPAKEEAAVIRNVRARAIGKVVTVRGIVTRVSDVRPQITVATYTCDECGAEIFQEVTKQSYMPLFECPSVKCKQNNARGQLHPQVRGSRFVRFQELKLQELPEQVPMGNIPRSMTVHLQGELTRKASPGDVVVISGVFLPIPFTGFRAMRSGALSADTYLHAMVLKQVKTRYEEFVIDNEMEDTIEQLVQEPDVYGRLASSIAPEIFGHEDVKRALLLVMVGGVTRQMDDGMRLRGDVHMCMMGDPGVAKSQLLKHIISVAPRGVYTNGKGSSGVGLTACVTRDNSTGELMLEGGALVLADMGICAIDEFDKMDETDRTAIHEVMEQQTVSIAKAGITTSLNARTSVLAAANPAWGRYDARRTPAENINMPAALLSRFDILWLMLDRVDEDNDTRMAEHVLHVHRHSAAPPRPAGGGGGHVDATTLRAFISRARRVTPALPQELTEYITAAYASLRQEEKENDAPHGYTTARTLLSILRLSQALARLRMDDVIAQADVDEALRLMQMSKMSLLDSADRDRSLDYVSAIYGLVRELAQRSRDHSVSYVDALNRAVAKGFNESQLERTLQEYADINVWQVDDQTRSIRLILAEP